MCSFNGSSVSSDQLSALCPGLHLGSMLSAWIRVEWLCCGVTSEHTLHCTNEIKIMCFCFGFFASG